MQQQRAVAKVGRQLGLALEVALERGDLAAGDLELLVVEAPERLDIGPDEEIEPARHVEDRDRVVAIDADVVPHFVEPHATVLVRVVEVEIGDKLQSAFDARRRDARVQFGTCGDLSGQRQLGGVAPGAIRVRPVGYEEPRPVKAETEVDRRADRSAEAGEEGAVKHELLFVFKAEVEFGHLVREEGRVFEIAGEDVGDLVDVRQQRNVEGT